MPLDLDEKRFEFDLGMLGMAVPFIVVATLLLSGAVMGFFWSDYAYLVGLIFAGAGLMMGWLLYPNYSLEYGEAKDTIEALRVNNFNLKEALLKGAENYAKLQGRYDEVSEKVTPKETKRKGKKPTAPPNDYPPAPEPQNAPVPPKTKKSRVK